MIQYTDLEDLMNAYNLTGEPVGTLVVPDIDLDKDTQQNYIITYTNFLSASDVADAGYYLSVDGVEDNFVTASNFRNDIVTAVNGILNPVDQYSVLFSDVAKIDFQEDTVNTGIITFGQLTEDFSVFTGSPSISAFATMYNPSAPNPTERYGDIWINRDQDSTEGATFNSYNIWDNSGNIDQGTQAYKVLLEEISHSLGIDIYDAMGVVRNSDLDSHKYTITSYNAHPDMEYDTTTFLGFPEDRNVINASGNPFPKGLQLFDVAALQEIYGRDYSTRSAETIYSKLGAFQSSLSDGSFIYTIWDGGGNDSIYAYDYDGSVKIDLRQGAFSSIGNDGDGNNGFEFTANGGLGITISKDIENVAIAYHTIIENATGTAYDDVLIGNDWGNILRGREGNDYIFGDGLSFNGDAGFSDIDTDNPNTTIREDLIDPNATKPTSDDDVLQGGAGYDFLYGGAGNDTAKYNDGAANGVSVTLDSDGNGTATDGFGDTDTLFSIENLILSDLNDTVTLDIPVGRLIDAGAGNADTITYQGTVVVDYNFGANGEIAIYDLNGLNYDTLIGVENVIFDGGVLLPDFNQDTNLLHNTLSQPVTNDYSSHVGGLDFDFLLSSEYDYSDEVNFRYYETNGSAQVNVSLQNGITHSGQTGFNLYTGNEQDLIHNYNNADIPELHINGTNYGDNVFIDTGYRGVYPTYHAPPILFSGGSGNDTIRISDDFIKLGGEQQADIGSVISIGFRGGNDTVENAQFLDNIIMWEGIRQSDVTINQVGSDTVIDAGIWGNITLEGVTAAPNIIWLSNSRTEIDGTWGNDSWVDRLGENETFYGLDGNDYIDGQDGDDSLYGGLGNDVIITGAGTDTAYGNEGDDIFIADDRYLNSDTFYGGSGTDKLVLGGVFSDYTVSNNVLSEISGMGSSYTVFDIESVQFDDGVYDITTGIFLPITPDDIITDDIFEVPLNSTNFVLDVLFNDNTSVQSIVAYQQTEHGAITLNSDQTFSYTPDELYEGTDIFTYSVLNQQGHIETATVTIQVLLTGAGLGTEGDDILIGDSGTNYLRGLSGNDVLKSMGGDGDILEGGLGSDRYHLDQTTSNATIRDLFADVGEETANSLSILYLNNPNITIDDAATNFADDNGNLIIYDFTLGGTNIVATIENAETFGMIVFDDGTYVVATNLLYGAASEFFTPTEGADIYYNDLYGGAAIDFLGGNDEVTGSVAPDAFYGGSGNDILDGAEGDDQLYGESGNDTLYEGDGIDIIDGGDDIDTLYVLNVNNGIKIDLELNIITDDGLGNMGEIYSVEKIHGTNFNDEIIGSSAGNEYLYGNSGDDILAGGAGNIDALYGGSGNDVYRFNIGDGIDTVYDSSGSIDVIEFGIGITQSDLSFAINGNTLDIYISGTNDQIRLSGQYDTTSTTQIERLSFYDGSSMSLIGESTITGNNFNNTIIGTAENDRIVGQQGNDHLFGGAGDDTYVFSIGDGVNTITETSGYDVLELGAGIALGDLTFTRIGDDLDVHIASGFLIKDFYSGNSDYVVEEILFNDGSTFDLTTLLVVNTAPVAEDDNFIGIEDTVLNGNVLADNGNGVDSDPEGNTLTVVAVTGLATALGGSVDILSNGDFTYTPAADVFGEDSFSYTLDDGNGGSDTATVTITISDAVDTFTGDVSDNTLTGTDGADLFYGGLGSDTLSGGNGDDKYYFTGGQDTITESGGNDVIYLPDGVTVSQISFIRYAWAAADLVIHVDDTDSDPSTIIGDIIVTNQFMPPESNQVETLRFVDGVNEFDADLTNQYVTTFGSNSGDTILGIDFGANPNETFIGFDDNDTIYAGGGQDAVYGGTGEDRLYGDDGADFLYGNQDGDFLYGGDGNDFIFGDKDDNAISSTYTGDDYIEGGAGVDWIEGNKGVDTIYGGTGDDIIQGNEDGDFLYGETGQDYIIGGAGNDYIVGGQGIDDLFGQSGADTFAWLSGDADAVDNVYDFSASEGDVLDISKILTGYTEGTSDITEFVQITDNGTDSTLAVDVDGGGDNFVTIATLYSLTGETATSLYSSNNLNLETIV